MGMKSALWSKAWTLKKISTISHLDHHTSECETEVQKMVHLQKIINLLADIFTYTSKVTKSRILATNAPTWVIVHAEQSSIKVDNELFVAC